ncbi:hypothetical protein [Ammoniphilus sp. 3BR4]|uniref:hypothetical protein n=1 Tax=Ammoniphilus sp. 3BR4 TaxID=3158265 RepID=UPI003466570D
MIWKGIKLLALVFTVAFLCPWTVFLPFYLITKLIAKPGTRMDQIHQHFENQVTEIFYESIARIDLITVCWLILFVLLFFLGLATGIKWLRGRKRNPNYPF